MASSAFKSTTRRTLHASASSSDRADPPAPCPRRSRSRSVSAAPRARGVHLEDDYANTRTNPLFDSAASPSASPSTPQGTAATSAGGGDAGRRDRGREPLKGGGRGGGGGWRARSVSVAPQRRRTPLAPSADGAAAVGARRASPSLARSVANDAHALPYRGSETDAEISDGARSLQSRRSRHTISGRSQQTDGTAHSVSAPAVSSPGQNLEHVSNWQQSHSNVPVDLVLEIPPEFDPDCAEFISDISDLATEYRKEDVIEIPLDFDTDPPELVSDTRHSVAKQHWEQMATPLEFDLDTSELAPDISEYTIKLKKSHEHARKLRADLAVEEQREQELSRMLKDIVTVPNFNETHKKRPRRKSSIERLQVSRHLAEEAMNYFEECVSISTMDSTDFSSSEDPQQNSIVNVPPKSNSRFFHKGKSSFQEPHTPAEELDKQTQCSISITGSDVSDSVIFSNTNAPGLKIRDNSSDDLNGFDTPRSRSSCFSFTREPAKTVETCDVRQYLGNFGRGNNKGPIEMRSSYFADDYAFQKANLDLLSDTVTFNNRIEYGGFLICNSRTF